MVSELFVLYYTMFCIVLHYTMFRVGLQYVNRIIQYNTKHCTMQYNTEQTKPVVRRWLSGPVYCYKNFERFTYCSSTTEVRQKLTLSNFRVCQRQKSFAVKKAKFRGTAKSRDAEFSGSFALKICNFAFISR